MDSFSLRAIPAPTDAVLPQARGGPGFLGVVMLDTCFPRPLGDIGHPDSFGVPVRQRVVAGAFPREVVASAAALQGSGLHLRFIDAARALQADGARAITTSCGFLVLLQQRLQDSVGVPVVSSSLLQLPGLLEREARVGVLTISDRQLTAEYLLAAGVPPQRLADVVVQGVAADSEFVRAILGNQPEMDLARASQDLVAAAMALRARAPDLRTVVLECTNMPPHAPAIRAATGWRLQSLLDAAPLLQWADA